jgi:hypothetical protein
MSRAVGVLVVACAALGGGCSFGPRALHNDRVRYNEAVKVSSEEQLLLNIVRLRYSDTPSSLGVTSLADQYEYNRTVGITPFFTAAAAGALAEASYRGTVLPQLSLAATTRPTLTYTPQDDQDFTRRLFTPISLEAVASLSKTTWPTQTVLRLWLENLNWVSNAETGSGPTPRTPPEFGEFRAGIDALQRLIDRKAATIFIEEQDDPVGDDVPADRITAKALAAAAKDGFEFRKVEKTGGWRVVRKKQQPMLRINPASRADPDFLLVCRAFRLDPSKDSFDFTTGKLDPYLKGAPKAGLDQLDMETRSLLQVLYFVANGVDIPPEHVTSGVAPLTLEPDGRLFDWQQVVGGLFRVGYATGHGPPPCAHVAVRYKGYWFYIDERDADTKATFSLLVELGRLQLSTDKGGGVAPLLTLPLGGGR